MTSLCARSAVKSIIRPERPGLKFLHDPFEGVTGVEPTPLGPDQMASGYVYRGSASHSNFPNECALDQSVRNSLYSSEAINHYNGRHGVVLPWVQNNHFYFPSCPTLGFCSDRSVNCGFLRPFLCCLCHKNAILSQLSRENLSIYHTVWFHTETQLYTTRCGGSARTQHLALPPCARGGIRRGESPRATQLAARRLAALIRCGESGPVVRQDFRRVVRRRHLIRIMACQVVRVAAVTFSRCGSAPKHLASSAWKHPPRGWQQAEPVNSERPVTLTYSTPASASPDRGRLAGAVERNCASNAPAPAFFFPHSDQSRSSVGTARPKSRGGAASQLY